MKKLLTIAALTASTFTAQAEIRINGFANLVGGITSSDDALYGYDDKISFSEQSLFAIQISGDINDKMTATAQIVSRGKNDYSTEFEWAYISYQINDNTTVSGGKFRVPLFRFSSTLDIGYSYHWITPPESLYTVSFNTIEGVRIDHNGYSGDWEYNLQLIGGTFSGDVLLGGQVAQQEINNILTSSISLQRDWFSIRLAASRATLTVDSPLLVPLITGLTANGFGELADGIALKENSGHFFELGFDIDKYNWFISGEYTIRDVEDSFLPEQDTYYVTAGLRIKSFTPHITYTKHDGDPKFLEDAAALPEQLRRPATGFLSSRGIDTTTITVGLRYDMDTNIALKLDLTQQQNDFNDADTNVNLIRVGINYIF